MSVRVVQRFKYLFTALLPQNNTLLTIQHLQNLPTLLGIYVTNNTIPALLTIQCLYYLLLKTGSLDNAIRGQFHWLSA